MRSLDFMISNRKENLSFKKMIVVTTLALTTLLGACSKTADASKSGQPVTELRYQSLPGVVTLPELAQDLGYFGPIKLKYVGSVQGGPQDLQALATNDVDIATAFNGAIIKLIAANVKIKSVVGAYGSDDKNFVGYYVNDNSPIHSARDLIGKKVAVNTLGAHYEFVLKDYLTRQGLTPDEISKVELTVLPPASTEQGLRLGQVDAAALVGLFQDKALKQGGIRKLFSDIDLYGSFTGGSYVFTEQFIKDHPDTVRQFVTGMAKATEWSKTIPREQVVARFKDIIHKRKRQESDQFVQYWRSYGVVDKDGILTKQQFQRWIDLFVQQGHLKLNQIDANKIFTNEFNPFASASNSVNTVTSNANSEKK